EVLAHLIEEALSGRRAPGDERREDVGAQPAAPSISTAAPNSGPGGRAASVTLSPCHLVTPSSFAAAVRAALQRGVGSYAVAVISQDTPDTVFVARKDSPLVIGLGDGENFLASDIPAVMRYTRRVLLLEDGDFAAITPHAVTVTDLKGAPVERAIQI